MNPEDIMSARISILNALSKEQKNLSDIAMEKGYLVTSVALDTMIEGKLEKLFFVIIDATSKQEDHLNDIEDYSLKLYNGFNQKSYLV